VIKKTIHSAERKMADLEIQRVTTRRQQKQFLEFPGSCIKAIRIGPPLRSNQKELVGYKPHPFYAQNSVQTFLPPARRVAADRGDTQPRPQSAIQRTAGFLVFSTAATTRKPPTAVRRRAEWFADQGVYKLRGPTNPSFEL